MNSRLVGVATYLGHSRLPWQAQIIRLPADTDFPREIVWSALDHCKTWHEAQDIANLELNKRGLVSSKISAKIAEPKPVLSTPKVDRQLKTYNLDDV